jgi:hypothetical protein
MKYTTKILTSVFLSLLIQFNMENVYAATFTAGEYYAVQGDIFVFNDDGTRSTQAVNNNSYVHFGTNGIFSANFETLNTSLDFTLGYNTNHLQPDSTINLTPSYIQKANQILNHLSVFNQDKSYRPDLDTDMDGRNEPIDAALVLNDVGRNGDTLGAYRNIGLFQQHNSDDFSFIAANMNAVITNVGSLVVWYRQFDATGKFLGQADMVLTLIDTPLGAPPGTEIPEPATAFLLGSALIAVRRKRGKGLLHRG